MGQENSVPVPSTEHYTTFGRFVSLRSTYIVQAMAIDVCNSGRRLTSGILELIARDDTRSFVHRDILFSQSDGFLEVISSAEEEAAKGHIYLKDWDGDTVARLVQYLYTGDYHYPDPSPIPPVVDSTDAVVSPPEPEPEPERNEVGNQLESRPLTPLKNLSIDDGSIIPILSDRRSDEQRLARTKKIKCDFKEPLLLHARLYVLAKSHSIISLKALAYMRLFTTLLAMDGLEHGSHLLANIADLSRYAYENTHAPISSQEPLRKLVSQFIALNFEAWQTYPEGVRFMSQGGDLVTDVMGKVCRRLTGIPMVRHIPEVLDPLSRALRRRYISKLQVSISQCAL